MITVSSLLSLPAPRSYGILYAAHAKRWNDSRTLTKCSRILRESVCRLRAPQTERVSAALRSHERGKAFETLISATICTTIAFSGYDSEWSDMDMDRTAEGIVNAPHSRKRLAMERLESLRASVPQGTLLATMSDDDVRAELRNRQTVMSPSAVAVMRATLHDLKT